MSKQSQFEMLGRVINRAEYARHLLERDVLPGLQARRERPPTMDEVRHVDGYGLVSISGELSDAQLLAGILTWIGLSTLAEVPRDVVAQASQLAARVLDYPAVIAESKRRSQSEIRKGKGKNYDPNDLGARDTRRSHIDAAMKRRGSEDRDLVVADLSAALEVSRSQASRILAQEGWPGREKVAKRP